MMKKEEIDQITKQLDQAMKEFDDWEIVDQLKFVMEVEKYLKNIKPIVEKYAPTKPFYFEIRRLDEIQ